MTLLNGITRKMAHKFTHKAAQSVSTRGYKQFCKALAYPQAVQREKLKSLLKVIAPSVSGKKYNLSSSLFYEEFIRQVPITEYDDWAPQIDKARAGSRYELSMETNERFQPTSGSTSKIKWIPYTQSFLNELDAAISPWMMDMYKHNPGMLKGTHYWSLSWVPTGLRRTMSGAVNDDLKLLPWWKRIFMGLTSAVPEGVSLADSSDDSQFATLCYLLADKSLSFLSVWSPTFALTLFDNIIKHKLELVSVLATGKWGGRKPALLGLRCPKSHRVAKILLQWKGGISAELLQLIWPKLSLVSAWDTSSSATWANKLQCLLPQADFQGKGLWATEGVVTIPFQNQYPLAICSHFYEFIDLETEEVLPAWKLKQDQLVRPILTTGSGLLRYAMKDKLRVSGFLQDCPCFEFLGRLDGIDLVGEKMSPEIALGVMKMAEQNQDLTAITVFAIPANTSNNKPFYLLLCEPNADISELEIKQVAANVETELNTCFHYQLARDLGQLDTLKICCSQNARELYYSRCEARGMVVGNIKIEPLMLWDIEMPDVFLEAIAA
ncbi:GH3 family domain-containing protein [Moritella viscosa]|uniref:GH3 auxin-responsive promoter n=1 Tax=Moritella viscosa TaxID=80854 RepID=A0A1L0C6C5_9GAMM|nr:GH3 auxin-responsive promoter family protein [Moritella viscosa]SGZ09880.1 GH3 auxin-responsive promoter [Moritella viscosa]SHO11562.1 GH3 auxin-responsive promoter [Moritella viscosa]SHO11564.1 GH3 auxin-responsive promoter [Moritella viscosa]SHO16217.1 GH3 auxin-responsive promoter [Moritella viscosa]SHO18016.1 GH3 auxin-responsive promoter [Moritella viscosa]